jgi:hypothetical protein
MFDLLYAIPLFIGYVALLFLFFPQHIYPRIKNTRLREKLEKSLPFVAPLFLLAGTFLLVAPLTYAETQFTPHNPYTMQPWLMLILYSVYGAVAFAIWFGIVSVPYILLNVSKKFWHKHQNWYKHADLGVGILTAIVFLITSGYAYLGMAEEFYSSEGAYFFPLNAAIKNTCIVDPRRENCPQTLEEISYIEPEFFAEVAKKTQMIYYYYPDTNQYTLVIRYRDKQAIVFDPRLIQTMGMDLHEYRVETKGVDHLVNPPSFPGPWDNLPDWDK